MDCTGISDIVSLGHCCTLQCELQYDNSFSLRVTPCYYIHYNLLSKYLEGHMKNSVPTYTGWHSVHELRSEWSMGIIKVGANQGTY